MRKVTTINLNNNAYQIDEEGYEALRAYLENAGRALVDNPDRAEILADLEQAIADKCRLVLGPHKTVVTTDEVKRILADMGPVEGASGATPDSKPAGDGTATGAASSNAGAQSSANAGRRMYRISDGAMWAGVCNGVSAYFGFDVVWVRLGFVLATVFGGGFGLLIYIAMIFIVPRAETAEQMATAHGQPFNAQELVDRVKKKHEDFRRGRWRHRRMRRHAEWWNPATVHYTTPPGYAARVTGGLMLPLLTVLSAAWFTAMVLAVTSVWYGYGHLGAYVWPPGAFGWPHHEVPRWIPLIAVIAVYALIAMPIGAGRRASLYYANGGRNHGWADAWSGLLWIVLVSIMLSAAWQFMPWLQDVLQQLFDGRHTLISV